MDNERDAVERVLKALKQEQVPGGLEARVAARLEKQAVSITPSVASVWWRGAASGAMATLLVVAIAMVGRPLVLRPVHITVKGRSTAVGMAAPTSNETSMERQSVNVRMPCASAGRPRTMSIAINKGAAEGMESAVKPGPITANTLTPQERSLVHVVQVAHLQELAMLNPEMRAQREADESAQFQSFFAHPAYKSADTNSAAEEPANTQPSTEPVTGENQ